MNTVQWPPKPNQLKAFDRIADRFLGSRTSLTESQALNADFWSRGKEARLREDQRFRQTTWGRWILADAYVANDLLYAAFDDHDWDEVELTEALDALGAPAEVQLVVCPGDPRLVYANERLRRAQKSSGRKPTRATNSLRDVRSSEGQAKIQADLSAAIDTYFEKLEENVGDAVEEVELGWHAELCLLEPSAGGLQLETKPLEGLPPFARTLIVSTGIDFQQTVLGSNHRGLTRRTAVPPSKQPYRWSAPDFDDLLADKLAELTVEGLSAESATAFRVDASAVGRRLTSDKLSPGQHYRILIPPWIEVDVPESELLGEEGWSMWELRLDVVVSLELRQRIRALGLKIGRSGFRTSWRGEPAVGFGTARNGEAYPKFWRGQSPMLYVEGPRLSAHAGYVAVLVGGEERSVLEAPAGDEWHLRFDELQPGRYGLAVVPEKKHHGGTKTFFEILEELPQPVGASLTVRLDGKEEISVCDHQKIEFELSAADEAKERTVELEIAGPAFWPLSVRWRGISQRSWWRLRLDEQGRLDEPLVIEELARLAREQTRADLVMDFGELGTLTVEHKRRISIEREGTQIKELYEARGEIVRGISDNTALLVNTWFAQLIGLLGYRMRELAPEHKEDAPPGVLAEGLSEVVLDRGELSLKMTRLLVIARPGSDLGDLSEGTVRTYAEKLCQQFGVNEAILSDGTSWKLHRRGAKLPGRTLEFSKLAENPESLHDFLFQFGAKEAL
jgi:hypothetical protein